MKKIDDKKIKGIKVLKNTLETIFVVPFGHIFFIAVVFKAYIVEKITTNNNIFKIAILDVISALANGSS